MKNRLQALTLGAVLVAATAIAEDTKLETNWSISGAGYAYVTSTSHPVPSSGDYEVRIVFPSAPSGSESAGGGADTVTYFGEYGTLEFDTPLRGYVGANPYGDSSTGRNGQAFVVVSDLTSTFYESVLFIVHESGTGQDGKGWQYWSELRLTRYSPSRGGNGDADFAFTSESLRQFLQDSLDNPSEFSTYYNTFWCLYDYETSAYVDGWSWSGTAGLMSVSVAGVVQPDSMLKLLGSAVVGVGPGESLADKVSLAQTYYAVPDVQATCSVLTDFSDLVRAQRGKKITKGVADDLNTDAQAIMTAIGCE